MKSIIFVAMLIIGVASCETPQQTTGTPDGTTTQDATTGSGTTGSGTTGSGTTGSGTTASGTTGSGTTGSSSDTVGKGTGTDTSTMKRDSLPR